jgi:CHASE3 domain sensor protein
MNTLTRMKIGARLTAGFAITLVALIAVGVVGYVSLGHLSENISKIAHKDWVKAPLAMPKGASGRPASI